MQRAWRGARFHQPEGVSPLILFLLFLAVPVAELFFLVHLAGMVGFLPTLGLVILTGIIGVSCVKSQGRRVLARLQVDLASGRPPAAAVVDGVLLLAAGLLLITPGVFTDAVGLLLLIAPLRRALGRKLAKHFANRMHIVHYRAPSGAFPGRMDGVIEGDWEEEDPESGN